MQLGTEQRESGTGYMQECSIKSLFTIAFTITTHKRLNLLGLLDKIKFYVLLIKAHKIVVRGRNLFYI